MISRLAIVGLGAGLLLFFLLPGQLSLIGAALAAGGAVAVPPVGLLAALATLPLHLYTQPVGLFTISSVELLVLAAALGTAMRSLPRGIASLPRAWPASAETGWLALQPSPFTLPIILLLASAMLSLLVSEYLRLSLRELRTLVLEPLTAYCLLLVWFPGRMERPVAAFLVGAVGVSVAGLIGAPLGWGTSQAEGVARLQATYPSANHLGLLLGRALPWLIALVWAGGRHRVLAAVGALIVCAALFTTFSLGAWLGAGAAALFLAWRLGGARWLALGLAFGGVVGLVGLLLFRTERLRTAVFRLHLWQSSLAMLRDHPVLGVGLDNFLYLYQQRYISPSALAEANLSHPHNLVLHFWLQLGLPGLIAAIWILVLTFRLALGRFAAPADRLQRALAIGAAGSMLDFVVHGAIDNSYFLPDMAVVFWLTVAVVSTEPAWIGDGAATRSAVRSPGAAG